MNIIEDQLGPAVDERRRIEAQVWGRTFGTPYPRGRQEVLPYLADLEVLMTQDERRIWRALSITIEELEKYLA